MNLARPPSVRPNNAACPTSMEAHLHSLKGRNTHGSRRARIAYPIFGATMKMLTFLPRYTLQRRVANVISAPRFEVERKYLRRTPQSAQVTRYEAVLVVQNAVLQPAKRPNSKERKLADVSKGWFLASSLSNALAEPKFRYATARYGAP